MERNLRKIVGLILWWTEGTKPRRDKRWRNAVSYVIEVTNTDARIIKLFLDFLRKDIGITEDRLKLQIQIHEDNNQNTCEEYWSKITHIPISRFNRTIIKPLGKKIGKTQGTCKIRYSDKSLFLRLADELQKIIRKL